MSLCQTPLECKVKEVSARWKDAVHMRELEEVDSASRGAAVHSAPSGCPSTLYMGTSKIRGQKSFYNYTH